MKNFTNLLIFLGIISFVIMGCAKSDSSSSSSSSSSSDTDVTAVSGSGSISLSAKVSVVEPKTTASTARTARTAYAIDTTGFATTLDYHVDETQTFVFEESADVLDTVNKILCMIGQSRPDLMLNEGNYNAQIDENKCGSGDGDSQSNAPDYEMWTVNATRSKGEPMIVKAWVPDGDDTINALMKVYRKPSTEYPIGFFKMTFKGVKPDGTEFMKGYMKTKKTSGGTQLQFYQPMNVGETTYDFSVKVNFNSDGSGSGATLMPNWTGDNQANGDKSFQVAYNTDYFNKQKTLNGVAQDAVCLDRNSYLTSVWRYGMYDSNGARVAINSGFPITATASGTTYNGYIGYYGLWMPSAAGVADNSTVTKMNYSNPDAAGDNYTVRSWGGKLTKWTKKTITLGSIKNIPLNWRDRSDSYKEKRVYWDGTNFKIDAVRNNQNNMWEDVTVADLSINNSTVPYGFHFYSQALGGDGSIQLTYGTGGSWNVPNAPADSTYVVFNTRASVFPGDSAPSKLACYERCPNPSTIASGNSSTAYLNFEGTDNASATTAYIYAFDNTTSGMVLKMDNNSSSVLLTSANENLPWGVNSGILFDNTTANFDSLRCSWDNDSICTWNARQALSTFYTWETGTKDWQKLTVLVDTSDNSSVKFDPPMSVKYTHSGTGSNSGKSYDNASFYLEYGGLGDLHGIPSFCVNKKTGVKGSCNDNSRWVNEIVIPAGSLATQVKNGTTEYVIKPLEMEQQMQTASSTSVCTAAGLSLGEVILPDSSGWTDPAIGPKPAVAGPPLVVGGEKKGS
jgi:hypothetical protein